MINFEFSTQRQAIIFDYGVLMSNTCTPLYLAVKISNFVRNKEMTKLPGYNYNRESFSHFFIVAIIIIFNNTKHNLPVKRVHVAVNVTMASGIYKSFCLFSEQKSLCLIKKILCTPRTKNY